MRETGYGAQQEHGRTPQKQDFQADPRRISETIASSCGRLARSHGAVNIQLILVIDCRLIAASLIHGFSA
jgi:hypothetical protein